jgi:hypothetical protein
MYDRAASMRNWALAIGFLLGLLSGLAIWVYDRLAARSAAEPKA